MMDGTEEPLSALEKEYEETRIITVIQRGGNPPTVKWDDSLSEAEVVACLFKAMLFMTLDDYIMDIFDDLAAEPELGFDDGNPDD